MGCSADTFDIPFYGSGMNFCRQLLTFRKEFAD
jgi:hypothetical protein